MAELPGLDSGPSCVHTMYTRSLVLNEVLPGELQRASDTSKIVSDQVMRVVRRVVAVICGADCM